MVAMFFFIGAWRVRIWLLNPKSGLGLEPKGKIRTFFGVITSPFLLICTPWLLLVIWIEQYHSCFQYLFYENLDLGTISIILSRSGLLDDHYHLDTHLVTELNWIKFQALLQRSSHLQEYHQYMRNSIKEHFPEKWNLLYRDVINSKRKLF